MLMVALKPTGREKSDVVLPTMRANVVVVVIDGGQLQRRS